jgi:phosphatidylglycerol:prolipoprotein diacylglycerol transferase
MQGRISSSGRHGGPSRTPLNFPPYRISATTDMLLADSLLHHFDPFAIHFTADFGIRWYGLAYATGFVLAWLLARWFVKSGRSPLTLRDVGDMMFAVILGVLVGGRLGYALFYDRALLTEFSSQFPYWSLFAINRGGMASHGGIIGVIVAVTIFGKRRGVSVLHILDFGALVSTIGLCLGRIANFINAELWGEPLPAKMQSYIVGTGPTGIAPPWWSVKYPQEIEQWMRSGDERLFQLSALRDALGDVDFPMKVINAVRHGDASVISTIKPLLTAYYPSQLIQAITDGPVLALILCIVWLRPRKPGVVGSWFLIAYAIMRIISEVFRQPDAGVALTFGLSRGQLLSAVMLATGCVCLGIACARNVPKMSGLLKPMHLAK